jgi:peptidyl-dipeptidase A
MKPTYTSAMRNRVVSAALSFALAASVALAQSSADTGAPTVAAAQTFVDRASAELLQVSSDDARAQWIADTDITEDTEATVALLDAQTTARTLALTEESHRFDHLLLPPSLRRQILLMQLNTPAAPKDPKLLAEQTQLAAELTGMYGKGKYCPDTPAGQTPAPGAKCMGIDEISDLMAKSHDPQELTRLWVGWHAIGAPMRDKYSRYIALQNIGAQELGYHDTGELWRAGYDMSPAQFSAELEHAWQQLEPLYRALHDYVRARLIAQYGKAADRPDGMIPAQLLGNMWAQEWGNIYDIVAPADPRLSQFKPLDLEAALKQQIAAKDPAAALAFVPGADLSSDAGHAAELAAARDMVHYGESFFKSLGFAPLPKTFWERSQFVHPRDAEVVCHASAWDLDFADDLRVKMCIEVSADYFTTVHHELGHNFYQRAYNQQPYLFRNGANDGFHEAIGDSIALSITPAYLKTLGLATTEPPAEADIPLQLRTALDKVAFLPFALALDQWRWQVFSGQVKPADYNKAWWALREKYQGVAPPVDRTESEFDPGAKNHIPTNVPYARYFLARIYQFQFFKAMCDASGYSGPLNRCSFYDSKGAGDKLNHMLEAGQSQPWQQTLKEMTGIDHLDAQAMIDYFAPLYTWLKEQNKVNPHP